MHLLLVLLIAPSAFTTETASQGLSDDPSTSTSTSTSTGVSSAPPPSITPNQRKRLKQTMELISSNKKTFGQALLHMGLSETEVEAIAEMFRSQSKNMMSDLEAAIRAEDAKDPMEDEKIGEDRKAEALANLQAGMKRGMIDGRRARIQEDLQAGRKPSAWGVDLSDAEVEEYFEQKSWEFAKKQIEDMPKGMWDMDSKDAALELFSWMVRKNTRQNILNVEAIQKMSKAELKSEGEVARGFAKEMNSMMMHMREGLKRMNLENDVSQGKSKEF